MSQSAPTLPPGLPLPAAANRRRTRRADAWLPYLLSLPALLVCIGILVPFVTALWYSLQRYNLAMPFTRGFIGLEHYQEFLSDPAFWNTLCVSAVFTVATVGVELLLGLGIALLLWRRSRVNDAAAVVLLLPLMTAPALASLMWKLMTNPGFGVLAWGAAQIGAGDFRWASAPSSAMFTVVLVDVWVYTPFMVILLLAGLRSLPPQPFEAARLDGVPAHFVLLRITLPMLAPFLLTATLFRTLDSIQQFDIVYAMTQGGPGDALMVFQVQAYLEFFQYTNVGRSAALLVVLWAVTYALSRLFIRHWMRLRQGGRAHG